MRDKDIVFIASSGRALLTALATVYDHLFLDAILEEAKDRANEEGVGWISDRSLFLAAAEVKRKQGRREGVIDE